MSDAGFAKLQKKEIYLVLQGDVAVAKVNGNDYNMPYYREYDLDELCEKFGVQGQVVGSRWNYTEALMQHCINTGQCDKLLRYFFDFERFDNLRDLGDLQTIEAAYKQIVAGAITKINSYLIMSRHELHFIKGHFYVTPTGQKPVIETPNLGGITADYIQGLRERCKEDLTAGNYDSVITKSRTLMEEVLVHILEENNIIASTKGNLSTLYNQVKTEFHMQQNNTYDGRINALLGGLEKIVQAIAEMRNTNSDAHGVGTKRIRIEDREAILIMNSAMTFCEYLLSLQASRASGNV